MPTYVLTTDRDTVYSLDENGAVLARTDGPTGWDYRNGWVILGVALRHHSHRVISLADAAAGADIGHGIVHDWDHGHYRRWGTERARSITRRDR